MTSDTSKGRRDPQVLSDRQVHKELLAPLGRKAFRETPDHRASRETRVSLAQLGQRVLKDQLARRVPKDHKASAATESTFFRQWLICQLYRRRATPQETPILWCQREILRSGTGRRGKTSGTSKVRQAMTESWVPEDLPDHGGLRVRLALLALKDRQGHMEMLVLLVRKDAQE